ncbi:MAG: DUF2807 domain-containing protein [Muribaculaceae bacterium]|nr:DUF2807 domain-containing protein [Muribaculaceae bacterium]
MTRKISILTLTLSLIVSILGAGSANGATAAETEQEYTFRPGHFTTLKVQDNVNVVYHCSADTTSTVTYRGTEEFDDAFIITNTKGTLKIQVNTEDVGKPDLPVLHIYSDALDKVENYSDFHLEVQNPAACKEFCVALMGNGTITIHGVSTDKLLAKVTAGHGTIDLSGSARTAQYRMVGTGTINAENVVAEEVTCKIFGGGSISCSPEKLLKTLGVGSTRVCYKGSPVVKHSGGGKLIHIEE